MFAIAHLLPLRQLLAQQLPTLFVSLIIAEFFYKFHSFTLECLAFLGTWYVLGGLVKLLTDLFRQRLGVSVHKSG